MNTLKERKEYRIYSDGSSSNNGSPDSRGGWGTIIVDPEGNETEISGFQKGATNNQMELLGVIEGFKRIPNHSFVEVTSDSKYVIDGSSKWIKGWVKKKFKDVKNVNLWLELIEVTKTKRIKWTWVKGHNDHPFNERCDKIAVQARN